MTLRILFCWSISGDVKREILGVNNTLDKVEILWDKLLTVVHDEHSSDIELDVVLALLVLKQVKRSSLGDEKKSSELKLTLNREVFDSKVLLPVIGQRFVELSILISRDVIRRPGPDWLGLVQLFILRVLLLDGLLFLLIFVFLVGILILSDILNLWFILLSLLSFLLLILSLIITDLLFSLLLDQESDGVTNELRVLLDNLLDLLLLEVLCLILLHVQDNLGSSAHGFTIGWRDGEGTSSR